MPKPSSIFILAEDRRQQQFVRQFFLRKGAEGGTIRLLPLAEGSGSGELWVRKRFPQEVEAYRARHTVTNLIVVIDADDMSVEKRRAQLDKSLGGNPLRSNERIARLVPKRNIETWILCLNARMVSEDDNYKQTAIDWTPLSRTAAIRLYEWTRRNAAVPDTCVPSLSLGIRELAALT